MQRTISGPVIEWKYKNHTRRYSVITMPFRDACDIMRVNVFDGHTNKGEQRVQTQTHVNSLASAVIEGEYTPTTWSCNVPLELQPAVEFADGKFTIELEDGQFLSQTDGGGRRRALTQLLNSANSSLLKEKASGAPDLDRVAEAELAVEDIRDLPITVVVYLDGTPATDFLNLQKSRPVDKTTIFSMQNATATFDDPAYNSAFEIARILHKDRSSPFFGNIRLDTVSKCPLPMSTLSAKSSSDLSTSLIGLATIGDFLGLPNSKLAACVSMAYGAVEKRYPQLLQNPSPLTPLSNSGPKGASCMWCGIGTLLALKAGNGPLNVHLDELAECCQEVMGHYRIEGTFNSGTKRFLIGELAKRFFEGTDFLLHDGVPLVLCQYLAASAYNVSPLKRDQRVTRS